jgi:hypothetical protein
VTIMRANATPAVAVPQRIEMPFEDVWTLAERVAASRLFAMTTPDQAFALMMLCQQEGLHPMAAVRRYHIIQGRPAMRSDAMQGELQARGWVVVPLVRTAVEARARFAHASKCPDGFELGVTIQQFEVAGLTRKDTWKAYPDDMLWARLISKATRTLDPGIIAGIMSTDEADDVAWSESSQGRHAVADAQAVQAIAAADVDLPGQATAIDHRAYLKLASDACAAIGGDVRKLHAHLLTQCAALGHIDGPVPRKLSQGIQALTGVYALHRDWMRREVLAWCEANAGVSDAEAVAAADDAEAVEVGWEPGADG